MARSSLRYHDGWYTAGLLASVGAPTSWTKSASNPIIVAGAVGGSQVSNPTVVVATGRLTSPLAAFYLWCAPHDVPGGIYLFTADDLEGPWTLRNSAAPVIAVGDAVAAGDHIGTPHVMWNSTTSELMMWVHVGGLSGADGLQRTYLWTSADGLAWTEQNSGAAVIASSDSLDANYAAYLKVHRRDGAFEGFYIAQPASGAGRPRRVTSSDGVTWIKDVDVAFPAVGSAAGPAAVPLGLPSGVAVLAQDSIDGLFHRARPEGIVGWTPPVAGGLPFGASGAFDDMFIGTGDFVYYDGKLWLFYHGNPTTAGGANHTGDAIGVAYADHDGVGFDVSWGKGPAPVAPPVVYTESFNIADQSTLGPDLTWRTPLAGGMSVVSNTARLTAETSSTTVLADQAISPDMYVEADITIGSAVGTCTAALEARFVTGARTGYEGVFERVSGTWQVVIAKRVAGTRTTLNTATPTLPSFPARCRFEVNGTTLTTYVNGVQVSQITDSSITTGDYAGVGGYRSGSTVGNAAAVIDNFEAAAL